MDYASWCTECLAERSGEGACDCGAATTIAPGAPGERPLVVGHLALLDSGPNPGEILSESCLGPRRFVGQGPFQTASWRHARKTVWMWRGSLEHLPSMDSPTQLPMWRLLASSEALLIDVPEQTAYYSARYARNRRHARHVPAISDLLDDLQTKLDLCGSAARTAALFDPADAADASAKAILSLRGAPASSHTYPEAMKSLLPAAVSSRSPQPWPRPPASARPATGANMSITRNETGPEEVRIQTADVGGSVMAHFLTRLHHETSTTAGRRGVAGLTGGRIPIRGIASGEGRAVAEHWETRKLIEPPPGIALPAWQGAFGHFWSAKGSISIQAPGTCPFSEPTPTIIGIGPYRTVGEAQLMALVERVWSGEIIPAALVVHERCDQRLLEWASQEFPGLPRFADNWEGNLAVIHEVVSRVLKWRSSL